MIRLVNQFDDSETRVSLATPTCGGCCCCCCCCCIISSIGAAEITSMNLSSSAEKNKIKKSGSYEILRTLGVVGPFVAIAVGILIFFNLSGSYYQENIIFGIGAGIVGPAALVWLVILYLAYRSSGANNEESLASALPIVILGSAAILIEGVGVFFSLFGGPLLLVYPIAAIIAIIYMVNRFRSKTTSKR